MSKEERKAFAEGYRAAYELWKLLAFCGTPREGIKHNLEIDLKEFERKANGEDSDEL